MLFSRTASVFDTSSETVPAGFAIPTSASRRNTCILYIYAKSLMLVYACNVYASQLCFQYVSPVYPHKIATST